MNFSALHLFSHAAHYAHRGVSPAHMTRKWLQWRISAWPGLARRVILIIVKI
ncbi:hypothetical protein OH687_07635 [Burkholderia anthina]|nr:hypothetical protein OH687_07635 [Burkholderia anthina]